MKKAILIFSLYLFGVFASYGYMLRYEINCPNIPGWVCTPEIPAVLSSMLWPFYWPFKASAVLWRLAP